jgi:hypothetical protein
MVGARAGMIVFSGASVWDDENVLELEMTAA